MGYNMNTSVRVFHHCRRFVFNANIFTAFILHKIRQYPVFGPSPLKKGGLYSIGFLCGDAGPYHECRDTPGYVPLTKIFMLRVKLIKKK